MAHMAHYREAHPMPTVLWHWVNLICMILLILSGIEIHYPVLPDAMGIARGVHLFCGIVITVALVARLIWSFFGKSANVGGTREQVMDARTFLPQKENRHQLIPWIKYYLFFKKEHPLSGKYGVPQKIAYFVFVILGIFAMAYTGFCLWQTTANMPIFLWFTNAVGGLMKVRIIHYCGLFWFVCFMLIHIYLANIEGFAPTMIMFFRKEHGGLTWNTKEQRIDGEDLLGHELEDYHPLRKEEPEEQPAA